MKSLSFHYQNARIEEKTLLESIHALDEYTTHLRAVVQTGGYESDEASINLCDDMEMHQTVADMVAQKKNPALKYIFVVGIGGSNLGTYAIYNALQGAYSELTDSAMPKIIFIDTVSTALVTNLQTILSQKIKNANEICINVISKSGSTTETIALFEILYSLLKNRFESVDERVVVTTDENSLLHKMAEEKGFATLFLPKKVGGRYSVFSAVGLFPLSLAGINTSALLAGAKAMREKCLSEKENPALVSTAIKYFYYAHDICITNNFFFNPELEMAGKWYRQLMGESIGKEHDIHGNVVHAGITPIVSIGSTDLHSMAQLYFGGPRDKFTCFVYASPDQKISIPEERVFPELVKNIAGKNLEDIMMAIYGGVKAAYQKNELPFAEILLPEISEETLGQYLQLQMMEMMYLAKAMGVNAFDQPNVEDYKEETRKLL
ncbi:MAG: hypothetical protein WCJ84_03520 [Candidatus Peregrinibacteria bacterium]